MSPTTINGRALGVQSNGQFTKKNTDPIPGGRLWPEAALTWNAMRDAAIADGIEPWEFMPAGSASSARKCGPASEYGTQWYFWQHQPPPAARPCTSNHGWGIAVDVKTKRAAAWLYKNAHRFGWSWDEGRRVGEWWHFRYVGAPRRVRRRIKRNRQLGHLWRDERKMVDEFDRLKRQRKNPKRRRQLQRQMRARMAHIRKQATSTKNGWGKRNRLKRYRTLKSRVS